MSSTVSTTEAPAPAGSYSQAVIESGFLFTAGQVGRSPSDGSLPETFDGEVRQALANLRAVVEAGGGSLATVVKTTCFITSVADFSEFDAVYREFFQDSLPARSTVCVDLAGGYRFEVEAIASVAPPTTKSSAWTP